MLEIPIEIRLGSIDTRCCREIGCAGCLRGKAIPRKSRCGYFSANGIENRERLKSVKACGGVYARSPAAESSGGSQR